MAAERHNLTRRSVLGAGAAVAAAAAVGGGSAAAGLPPAPATPPSPPPPLPRAARPRPTPPIDIVCSRCGGNNVGRDAWAEWDTDSQAWVLGSVFDYGHCHDCDDERRLEEVELPAEGSGTE